MSLIDVTYFDNQKTLIPAGSYDNREEFITNYEDDLINHNKVFKMEKKPDVVLDVRDGCLGAKTRKRPQQQKITREQLEKIIKSQIRLIIDNAITQKKGE